MSEKNYVFIATSLDGYIADKNGSIDWLHSIPNPDNDDMGFNRLYIDGGTTIRNFLKADLIDEMVLTTIPVLLGGGSSLFGELPGELRFELIETKTFLNQITQSHYKRIR